jgi:hypothetical protein
MAKPKKTGGSSKDRRRFLRSQILLQEELQREASRKASMEATDRPSQGERRMTLHWTDLETSVSLQPGPKP